MHQNTRRAREVAFVLLRHGFESLLDHLDLRVLIPGIHSGPPATGHHGPAYLRRAFEELGPTFSSTARCFELVPLLIPYAAELTLETGS